MRWTIVVAVAKARSYFVRGGASEPLVEVASDTLSSHVPATECQPGNPAAAHASDDAAREHREDQRDSEPIPETLRTPYHIRG